MDLSCLIPNWNMICCVNLDIKLDPWSDFAHLCNPTKVKKLINDLTIIGSFIYISKWYCFREAGRCTHDSELPLLVFSRGPTQSIITQENGSSNAGIGISGAHCIF